MSPNSPLSVLPSSRREKLRAAGAIVKLLLVALAGDACSPRGENSVSDPQPKPASAPGAPRAENPPPIEVIDPVVTPVVTIELTGWRDLKWGDTPEDCLRKLAVEQLLSCRPNKFAPKFNKGVPSASYICGKTPKEESGLTWASLSFLNNRLSRVVAVFEGMKPGSAPVNNLSKALSARYCPLADDLGEAVSRVSLGNIGQTARVSFACENENRVRGGNIGIRVKTERDSATVEVFLTSTEFAELQEKNEFTKTF